MEYLSKVAHACANAGDIIGYTKKLAGNKADLNATEIEFCETAFRDVVFVAMFAPGPIFLVQNRLRHSFKFRPLIPVLAGYAFATATLSPFVLNYLRALTWRMTFSNPAPSAIGAEVQEHAKKNMFAELAAIAEATDLGKDTPQEQISQ